MDILHGNWTRGRLWVWKEGAQRPVPCPNPAALFAKPPEGTELGADLKALAALWRFATEAIEAKCVLPSLSGRRSRWTPLLCAADRARLATLCEAAASAFRPDSRAPSRVPSPSCPDSPAPSHDPSPSCPDSQAPSCVPAPYAFFLDAVDIQMRKFCLPFKSLLLERFSPSNPHSSFLASLATPNGEVAVGSDADLAKLASSLETWRGQAMPAQCESPALGFKIADPTGSDSVSPLWRLVPVAITDSSARPVTRKLLDEIGPAAARRILLALGGASRLFHGLSDEDGGSAGRFAAATLDGAALRSFMESAMPRLAAAGFPVFAPRWWKPASARRPFIRAVSAERIHREGAFSLDSIVNVKWEVVLGGTGISARELKWIAENEVPVAKIGGKWMNVDPELVKEAASTLATLASRTTSLRDLVRLGMGVGGEISVEVPDAALPAEARRLTAPLRGGGKLKQVAVPEGFAGSLRPYQRQGLDWLSYLRRSGFGACLADDMGLGKTIEAIVSFLDARRDGVTGPFLVVCPMSIMLKWLHEARRFAPSLSSWIYHGLERPHGADFIAKANRKDICITSYQMLAAEIESIGQIRWAIVALDEAQNIKNPETMKSRAARSLDASWRLAITGTPVENGITDIWAIMDFVNRGLLPGKSEFERKFGSAAPADASAEAATQLRRIVAPFVLRRVKADPEIAAGLPDKVEEKVFCHLTVAQASLYAAETAAAEKDLAGRQGISRRGAVLALITRLKQICDYPTDGSGTLDPEQSGKLATLDEMLDQVVSSGEAALVFTQYATFGHLLAAHLSEKFGFEVPFLHGGVPATARAEMVRKFQEPSGPPIFLISIRAGGLGFDLTRANHVFHYDRWWNPATESQATDRAHRIGQTKTVFVHTFICDGTLESKIDDLISGKRQLAGTIVTDGASWLAGLDDRTLMEVVSLSREMH